MKTTTSLALFSLLVFVAGCTSLRTAGEVQYGRQALLEGKRSCLAIFTALLKPIPIMSMRPAVRPDKVFGVMSDGRSISPAGYRKPGKPWNGRLPQIEKKISPGSIWV